MATITLLTSTKYNIVSITASTKTIVVSGDATAQIAAGRKFRLAGTASDDGFYTVDTSTYSSPNTTIVCTEDLTDDGGSVGTADLQRVLSTDADWDGGTAPGVSDIGIIPADGNLNVSDNNVSLTCESGGTVTLNGSNNYGSLTCESGGTVTLNGSNNGSLTCESGGTVTLDNGSSNNGSLTCESGGTVTLNSSYNNVSLTCESGGTVTLNGSSNYGSLTCESGGTVTLDNGSSNNGSLTCESGGTVTLDNGSSNNGSLTCWLYGTVTGATPIQFAIEKRTTHYTSGALDGIAGKITIRNASPANALYSMLGSYMTDCTAGNILTTKTIAEVAGTFDNAAAIAAEYISLNTNSNKALVLSGTELTGDNGTIGPGTAAGSTTILAGSFCLGLGL